MLSYQGAHSTPSALTKLTSRLNFLKVGRSQEGKGSERHQTLPSPNRYGGSEINAVPLPEKGRGLESSQQLQDSDRASSGKGKSHQNPDKLKKSESQPGHHSEGWSQHSKHLERGRSEGHHQAYNVDKGR